MKEINSRGLKVQVLFFNAIIGLSLQHMEPRLTVHGRAENPFHRQYSGLFILMDDQETT